MTSQYSKFDEAMIGKNMWTPLVTSLNLLLYAAYEKVLERTRLFMFKGPWRLENDFTERNNMISP